VHGAAVRQSGVRGHGNPRGARGIARAEGALAARRAERHRLDRRTVLRAGDANARHRLDDAATCIGIATANVCSVVDPSLVVLGGALLADGALLEPVRQIVSRFIPMPAMIVTTSLDKDAPLWGSVLVATKEARERLRQQLGRSRAAM
jgi:predicted NBD/HSP70 family sugar kinase